MEDHSNFIETTKNITFTQKNRFTDRVVNNVFRFIHTMRIPIAIFWLIAALAFAYPAIKFLDATSLECDPPKNSLAHEANQLIAQKYPNSFKVGDEIIVIKRLDGQSVLTNFTETFSHEMYKWLMNEEMTVSVSGYYINTNRTDLNIIDEEIMKIFNKQYIGDKGDLTIMKLSIDSSEGDKVMPFIERIREKIDELNNEKEMYYTGITGFEPGSLDLQNEVMKSLLKMDLTVIPIAILILLWVLQSASIMLIPLCTLITSISCSFGLMYPITYLMNIYGIAPALMMSCIAAVSIDYSLFLLKRWQEETLKNDNYYECNQNMFHHAGRIILTSGGLLALCFVSLCFFPLEIIISLGISAAISIFFTLIINLTLVPSLIGIFPKFFAKRGFLNCIKRCEQWSERRERKYHSRNTLWHKYSVLLSNKIIAMIAIIVCLLLIAPLCYFIKDFSWNQEEALCVPEEADSMISREYVLEEYDDGMVYPYEIVISGNSKENSVFSTAYYNVTRELMNNFLEYPEEYGNSSYFCINHFGEYYLKPIQVQRIIRDPLYNSFFKKVVSPDNTTSKCSFIPKYNPLDQSMKHLEDIRTIIAKTMEKYPQFTIYVSGQAVDETDSIIYCFKYFPIIVAVLFVIIMIITGISFQSVIVPIRVALSTFITVLWIYGFASLVYGTTYFDWVSSVMEKTSGFFWCVPLITLPIIIGLSSDYDIFLFSRIQELRRKGLSTRLSTIVGMEKSGYLISYAGIIMAIAFSGLFLSDILMLRQFAFILMFSVLLDTFVIRTILLPSIVHILGEMNWVPKRYETEYDNYNEYDQMISPYNSEETPYENIEGGKFEQFDKSQRENNEENKKKTKNNDETTTTENSSLLK